MTTPLHLAAAHADAETIRALIRAGTDPNARNRWGQTPLHVAAFWCNPAAAATLARLGADPDARDQHGRTPLDLARHRCNTEMIAAIEDGKVQTADSTGADDSHLLSF